jgi:hypothetical protein
MADPAVKGAMETGTRSHEGNEGREARRSRRRVAGAPASHPSRLLGFALLRAFVILITLTGCHPLNTPTPSGRTTPAVAPMVSRSTAAAHPSETASSIPTRPQGTPHTPFVGSEVVTITPPITDTAMTAFVWSYLQLLDNWNPTTGLVRDRDEIPSGAFDAIQATGSLAAATAMAEQLGVISRADAIRVVNRIGQALLFETPRYHGLWPHFVKVSPGGAVTIAPGTEWSSVDTVIAAIGLLTAQYGLGLDTAETEAMLRAMDWADLTAGPGGMISQGYADTGERFTWAWDVFGTESWLVELAYAGATGRVAPLAHPAPPTANGAGFIDELAWLFVLPPSGLDYWGNDWPAYRSAAANRQIGYYPKNHPASCLARLGLFGLSAAAVPDPSQVSPENAYQAFGVGGRFAPVNDGSTLAGAPVVTPHYAAMIALLRPPEAITMWDWLIKQRLFSRQDNVESLMFPAGASCDPGQITWNGQRGSWNLALQTLGWGRYLAKRRGQVPVLWQATTAVPLLRDGYRLLAPNEAPPTTSQMWSLSRECEESAGYTVGQVLERPNASGLKVHGQFGVIAAEPWSAQPGYARYAGLVLPQTDHLYLRLRYSKFSPPSAPILIYLDDEPTPRAARYPVDQGGWDRFAWTEPILLGNVVSGTHTITFATAGQTYGVADLDLFILANAAPAVPPMPTRALRTTGPTPRATSTATPQAPER